MRKHIGWAGVLSVFLWLLLSVAAQAQYQYIVKGGKVTLTKYTGPGGSVVIPSAINGLPVTGIGPFMSSGNGTLTRVAIPNSVTNIGGYAFYGCSNLVGAVIGSQVAAIGDQAFRYCSKLTTVAMGARVARIGNYAFANCPALTGVVFPANLATLGTGAFMRCASLKDVSMSNRIQSIGDFAFYGCSKLSGVMIGSGIRTIGSHAFNYCPALVRVVIGRSLAEIKNSAFQTCPNLTAIYFFGNVPRFGSNFRSAYGAKALTLYYLRGTTGWPSSVQGYRTVPFTRLPTISLAPPVRSASHLGGATTFAVTNTGNGTMTYAASESLSWLNIVGGSNGVNRGTITVTIAANPFPAVRIGTITVVSPEATNSPQIVKIVQPGKPYLSVTPSSTRMINHLAGTTVFAVTNLRAGRTMAYTVSDSVWWLAVTRGASGNNSGTFNLYCAANYGASARTGTVTVTAPGATGSPKTVKIVQAGRPKLSVLPSVRSVGYPGGWTNFAVANTGGGSMRYTATVANASTSWLQVVSGGTGGNSGTVTVSVDDNPGLTARTGTLVVAASPGTANSPASVRVVQVGRPVLSATPTQINPPPIYAGQTNITIANLGGGTMAYTASVTMNTNWLSIVAGANGTNAGILTVQFDAGFGGVGAQGQITVTAPGVSNSPVTITFGPVDFLRRKAALALDAMRAGPVAVVTSDDIAPVYDSGWAAVDGDPETAWTGQKTGGGYILVGYDPALDLEGLAVDLAEGSLADVDYLYSVDGEQWQPLPEDLESSPVSLNFLWLVFPGDGTDAVPRVREISPNP